MTFPTSGTPFAANPFLIAALIGVVAILLFVIIFTVYLIFHQDTREANDVHDNTEPGN